MSKKAEYKLIANGHIFEVYGFEEGCYFDYEGQGGRKKDGEEKSERCEEIRKTSTSKARDEVRRKVLANFGNHSKFLTLTFKENKTDVKACNALFKKFIKKLKYFLETNLGFDEKLKYLAVIEFQKRGAVHYHMICNMPYVEWESLLGMWRKATNDNGGVDVRNIKQVDNVGAYMVKYMLKNIEDDRLQGLKSYLCSKGLDKSSVVRGDYRYIQSILNMYGINMYETEKVFTNSYESEHHGQIDYFEFNLKRL